MSTSADETIGQYWRGRLESHRRRHEVPRPVPDDMLVPLLPASPPPGGERRRGERPRDDRPRDLIGSRGLAWLGGITTAIGIVLFLALAISRGWVGYEGRTVLAGLGSVALIAASVWLHERRGATESAVAMAGAGIVGMFATMLVAGSVYHVLPPTLALAGALATGAVATALSIRWAGQALGAIGLVGALLSPVLVGAPTDASTVAVLWVAAASATAVAVWRDWRWLALAAPLISAPQWLAWIAQAQARGQVTAADVAVLAAFAALGVAGGIGVQARSRADTLRRSAAVLLVLNACLMGAVGELVLGHFDGASAGALWLAGLGAVQIVIGASARPRMAHDAHSLLILLGAALCDVAFSIAAGGIVLALGWGAIAIACTWLIRRTEHRVFDETVLGIASAAHIGFVLVRTIVLVPPSHLFGGNGIPELLAVATLAACCIACGQVTESEPWRRILNVLALAAVGYLTAAALAGDALVLAWSVEAAGLYEAYRRTRDRLAFVGASAFLAGAATHVLIVDAPPSSLLIGAPALHATAIALAAVAAALLSLARTRAGDPTARIGYCGAAATLVYLASVAIVTAFQPAAGTVAATVLSLGVRQQGQVLVSILWSVLGLAALVVGLRRRLPAVRAGGLVLLLAAVAKVFIYDLSTLTSLYRVISFVVLGLLLLAGSFAYQLSTRA